MERIREASTKSVLATRRCFPSVSIGRRRPHAKSPKTVATLVAVMSTFGLAEATAYAQKMYWTDRAVAKIQRAELDGSDVEDVVTAGLTSPYGLAIDPAAGEMYWTDSGASVIRRSNLEGSGIEDLITTGIYSPLGIALDLAAGKMYWVDAAGGIQRADLSGSNVEVLGVIAFNAYVMGGIALDPNADKMYVSSLITLSCFGTILRSNIDGSGSEEFLSCLERPIGIAIDAAAGKVYWTDVNRIQRRDLDGSNIEDLVTTGLTDAHGIALNLAERKMYWTDWGTSNVVDGEIRRANLDGSDVEVLVTGVDEPAEIVVTIPGNAIPAVSAWAAATMALLLMMVGGVVIRRREAAA